MNILVIASACRKSGALNIYKQFISHLSSNADGHRWYVLKDSTMPSIDIANVKFFNDDDHSKFKRIFGDKKKYLNFVDRNNLSIDCIVSLQNIGVNVDLPQLIYYHQSIPFYDYNWNPFKKSHRLLWMYKHFYPYFVRKSLNDKTQIVVQIPFIKKRFAEVFNFSKDKIHVLFPDTEEIDISKVEHYQYKENTVNFLYPAIPADYKLHSVLAKALGNLSSRNSAVLSKIRIHLTLSKGQHPDFDNLVTKLGLQDQFVYHGVVDHAVLLSMYKSSDGLLFPSIIETLGLPLLEAAAFGKPILVADAPYSREVISNYEGAKLLSPDDINLWTDEIENLAIQGREFTPIERHESDWPKFFQLIDSLNNTTK